MLHFRVTAAALFAACLTWAGADGALAQTSVPSEGYRIAQAPPLDPKEEEKQRKKEEKRERKEERREDRKERREERQERREPSRPPSSAPPPAAQDRREKREERREDRRDARDEKRNERREKKDDKKDERRDVREQRRDDRQERRDEKREERRDARDKPPATPRDEKREERREKRDEKRDAREERRDDRRDDRRDVRDDKRDDRRDARDDKRDDRREDRDAARRAREERAARQERRKEQIRRERQDARDEKRDDRIAERRRREDERLRRIREGRRERREGGRIIIEEPDRRRLVRENGRLRIWHDDGERFRRRYRDFRVEKRGRENWAEYRRPDGTIIIVVTDDRGRLIRRIRRFRGRDFILFDNAPRWRGGVYAEDDYYVDLPPPRIRIPRERYEVEADYASEEDIEDALDDEPIEDLPRAYTLDEIRYSVRLRERLRSVNLDSITFDFGSWEIGENQYDRLETVAAVLKRIIRRNPNSVVLVEGHTDAVGSDEDNLSLSDRRAEAVANVLTDEFGVPAENLVTQGYGEQFLKIDTQDPERANRRVVLRNITDLLKDKDERDRDGDDRYSQRDGDRRDDDGAGEDEEDYGGDEPEDEDDRRSSRR